MLVYAFFRNSLHPPGSINKYYIISVTGILFFSYALLRFDTELKVKISLLMVSFTLSIYAIEVILSYNSNVKPEHIRARLAEQAGRHYDSRHRAQVWTDLRNKGVNAYPLYNPYDNMDFRDTEVLPLGYISDITTIFCNENGKFIIFKSDEYGFNNPDGLYKKDNIDYVLIGDSFTQGACVERDENIAGRLMSAGRNVINLGMVNSGPPKELAVLKEYAKPFRPKTVFWLFYEGNDHEGLEFEKKSPLIIKYLDRDFTQALVHKQKLVDEMILTQLEKEFATVNDTLKLIEENKKKTVLKKFNISLSSVTLPQLRKILLKSGKAVCKSTVDPLFKDIMTEAKRVVDNWGGQIGFVYLPSYDRYMEKVNKCRISFLDTEKKEVLSVIKSLDIPVIDVETVFSSHPDPLSFFPYKVYGHYNARGYMTVAEQIKKYLSDDPENSE
jgi:hypothetical protein